MDSNNTLPTSTAVVMKLMNLSNELFIWKLSTNFKAPKESEVNQKNKEVKGI